MNGKITQFEASWNDGQTWEPIEPHRVDNAIKKTYRNRNEAMAAVRQSGDRGIATLFFKVRVKQH